MISAYEIFAKAERVELAGAELYRRVAETLPWSSDDRRALLRLEGEEIQHAARIRLLAAQYRNDPRLFRMGGICVARLDAAQVEVDALARDIARGAWGADLEGLKLHLADMEEAWGASHVDVLADCADGNVARFFRDLARQDHQHRAILLGDVPAREAAAKPREVPCRRHASGVR